MSVCRTTWFVRNFSAADGFVVEFFWGARRSAMRTCQCIDRYHSLNVPTPAGWSETFAPALGSLVVQSFSSGMPVHAFRSEPPGAGVKQSRRI